MSERNFGIGFGLVVLGVCVGANTGSAETLEPSAFAVARPASLAISHEVPGVAGTTWGVRRYYKPPPPPPAVAEAPPRQPRSDIVLRGGVFSLDSATDNDQDGTFGMKVTGRVGPILRLGISGDVIWRSNDVYQGIGVAADVDSWLYPVMAVAEVGLPMGGVRPYVGAAGGWEFMHLRAFNYQTGLVAYADYDAPGWQGYAGLDIPVARAVVLNAEGFYNGSTVDRTVYDPYAGLAYREEVDVDGWDSGGG